MSRLPAVGTSNVVLLTSSWKLRPTRAQRRLLEQTLERQRQLYNAALEERIDA